MPTFRGRAFRSISTLFAVVGAIVLAISGIAGAAVARSTVRSNAAKNPIILAGICDYTGPAPSPESCQFSQDYFKWLDARGGINGHQVQYTPMDEADSESTAEQDGARAVESLHIDAFVGGYGTYECTANLALYRTYKVYNLAGPEADSGCWKSPYVRPMNAGPWVLDAEGINYFAKYANDKRICVLISSSSPASLTDGQNVINVMAKVDGVRAVGIPYAAGTPITPVASDAVSHNCQGFVAAGTEPESESLQRALAGLDALSKMKVMQEVVYSTEPSQLGSVGNGMLAMSGCIPYWADNTPALKEFHMLLTKFGMAADSFDEYGFLSDELFTQLVSKIKGPLNRATIGHALASMKNQSALGIEGGTLEWGTVDTLGRLLVVKNQQWDQAKNHWYALTVTKAQLKSIETGVPLK